MRDRETCTIMCKLLIKIPFSHPHESNDYLLRVQLSWAGMDVNQMTKTNIFGIHINSPG